MKKILFVVKGGQNHQMETAKNLSEGMLRHKQYNITITDSYSGEDADLCVFWGHKRLDVIENQKRKNRNYLVIERAYIGDRFNWVSLGYNGLNGRADFCNSNITDMTRWNKHFSAYMQEWKENKTNKVLLVGQVRTDAAVSHIDIHKWYSLVSEQLIEKGYDVVFRPHPLAKDQWHISNNKIKIDTTQVVDFSQYEFVVTFSSNTGVLSVLNGTPTYAYDEGSMIYNVSTHDIFKPYVLPNRSSWCAKIAYTQWLPDEIKNGEAWQHLKGKIE